MTEDLHITPNCGTLKPNEWVDVTIKLKENGSRQTLFNLDSLEGAESNHQDIVRCISTKIRCFSADSNIVQPIEIVFSPKQNKCTSSKTVSKADSAKSGVTALRSAASLNTCHRDCESIKILSENIIDFKFYKENDLQLNVISIK